METSDAKVLLVFVLISYMKACDYNAAISYHSQAKDLFPVALSFLTSPISIA